MKKIKMIAKFDKCITVFVLLLIPIVILCYYKQKHIFDSYKQEIIVEKYLKTSYHEINSPNPSDTNYSDLYFLKPILSNVNILILGEQQHGDGSTSLMKTRLIQFLHEQCGFTEFVMETSMFDTYLLSEAMKNKPKEVSFSTAFYPFWYKTKESNYLNTYLISNANSTNRLALYGMDIQPTGFDSKYRTAQIERIIKTIDSSMLKKYQELFSIMSSISNLKFKSYSAKLSDMKKQALLYQINEIINDLSKCKNKTENTSQLQLFFSNLKSWLHSNWYLSEGELLCMRDSLMAENFFYLKNNKFKDKKIIIWTANSHAIYNDFLLTDNYKRFGSYLKERYRDSVYAINFTSYNGYVGSLYTKNDSIEINQSNYKSCELLIHNLNKKYLFYDFQSNENIKKHSFTLKCLGHNNLNSFWGRMIDGLIYIDNMKPIHY